jgi:hypothetical protein
MAGESGITPVWDIIKPHATDTTINDGNLTVGADEAAEQLIVTAEYNGMSAKATVILLVAPPYAATGTPVYNAKHMSDIKFKFSGSENKTGKAGVGAAFRELSAFIKDGGLTNTETENVIKPGDYIDLEAGLTVEAYKELGGYKSADDPGWDQEITLNDNSQGYMRRLIVVGINSFNNLNGNGATQHVVFQFQNSPVKRRMNETESNTGGYPASEMRKYLAPVVGVDGSGTFLAGLYNAGVPEEVLWGPARVMSTKNEDPPAETIQDLLWLPTEYEMFGKADQSVKNVETAGNQASFKQYYTGYNRLIKASQATSNYPTITQATLPAYWLASAGDSGTNVFCVVFTNATPSVAKASNVRGVSPAFCVAAPQPKQ